MKSDLTLPAYGAAAALLLILVWEWLPASETFAPVPVPSIHPHGKPTEADSVAKDTQAWARAITQRPLFNIGRKPPKLASGHGPVSVTGLPRLSGIMITRGGRRAIFMPDGGKALTLGEGAALDDYTIRRILPDQVILNGAKGDMALRPAYDAARGGGTTINPEMPPQIGFQPGFPGQAFNPAFRPPGMPMPQAPPMPSANDDDDNTDAQTPAPPAQPQPFPGQRGPFIPRGRTE